MIKFEQNGLLKGTKKTWSIYALIRQKNKITL